MYFNEEVDRVRSVLREHLPWPPLDFIPGLAGEGDRVIHVDYLTRQIEEENDLRFVDNLGNGEEMVIFAERLPWDSDFFGYGVAKLYGVYPLKAPLNRPRAEYADVLRKVLGKARDRGINYLFAQVDPRDLSLLRALGELRFSLIETRVYYHLSVKGYQHKERYHVRFADANDIGSLGRAAQEMVNVYDRFHSDPFIRGEDADRLMYKWVEASILESFADITVVPDFPRPTAFCTVRYHKENWATWKCRLSQISLAAVSNQFKGWFRKLISETNYHFQEIGVDHSYYVTQVTNKAVIWVLESLGYHFGRAEHIFRIIL